MARAKIPYDPANDTFIMNLFLDRDAEGKTLEVESLLNHSEEHGYYLSRRIVQVRKGRTWETATEEESEAAPAELRRTLGNITRPLTPHQVLRLLVENLVPEQEGVRSAAIRALESAGIR